MDWKVIMGGLVMVAGFVGALAIGPRDLCGPAHTFSFWCIISSSFVMMFFAPAIYGCWKWGNED